MTRTSPSISVVISTYNSPNWLEKVLAGYSNQTYQNFEVVIADDGSSKATEQVVQEARRRSNFSIKHVWQADKGFRKCRILNKAVLFCEHQYIIFTDGDCIPRRDFVAIHGQEAMAGRYLSGTYFKLPMATSQAITPAQIDNGDCFRLSWLHAHGLSYFRKAYKIGLPYPVAKFFNAITTTRCNFKGSNGSAWRDDILNVNGFDERMHWGGEDREFGVRLMNSGVQSKHVRFDAVVIHLDHARGYVNPELVLQNKQLRQRNERQKVKWTDFGIAQIDKDLVIIKQ